MASLRAEIRQKKPFPSRAEEVLLNLLLTADRLANAEAVVLKGHGLTVPQYNVLRILRGAGKDGHPCQEIGARMIARVPDVTRLVDRLEAAGLVQRERSATDRRVVQVRIRKAGLELLAGLDGPMTELPPRLLSSLSRSDMATLNTLLEKARAGL
jgi:DNA-binding MarR family transcriptional regulator